MITAAVNLILNNDGTITLKFDNGRRHAFIYADKSTAQTLYTAIKPLLKEGV